MIKIEYKKDEDTLNEIREGRGIGLVYIDFSVDIEGSKLFEDIGGQGYFADYFYMFLKVSLEYLPKLDEGKRGQFELEGPFEVVYEPEDSCVSIYLEGYNESSTEILSGEKHRVDLKTFAEELIDTSKEFLSYVQDVTDQADESNAIRELKTVIADSENWYEEKYDEKI